MRTITELLIFATARAGSCDSAAAMVVISAPVSEKYTVTAPASTATQPFGMKPPYALRLRNVAPVGEVKPQAYAAASAMNTTIAATFMEANQNSNSPYERADMRFTAVMMPMSASPSSHGGKPSQPCRRGAPANASTGTTIIQKYQYSQPATNPAHGPKPARANSVKERTAGSATAISPSMRITSSTSVPVIR